MGILDFFRKKGKSKKPTSVKRLSDVQISTSDQFLRIRDIDFFGPFEKSPNGEYIVGWQDSDYKGRSRSGHRDRGFGRVILVKGNQIFYQVEMERPNDGSVANNGRVAINDWRFGLDLNGIFYVLERDGRKMIEQSTSASLYKCGISDDGQLAWCNSSSSEDENYSDKIFIFSLWPPKLLFKIDAREPPERIESVGAEIHLALKGTEHHFTKEGELLNVEEVREGEKTYKLKHGSGYDLFYMAEEILQKRSPKDLSEDKSLELSNFLLKALERDIADSFKAKIHRRFGEIAEGKGDPVEALKQYTLAIEYDPKVGVKRALARLEKQLRKKSE